MILYRGDTIYNEMTNPKIYRFDGLRSKAFGKGDPSYINKIGLVDAMRQHIKPISNLDKEFYSKTDFISFSKSIERAMFWLKNKNSIEIVQCYDESRATRFLFQMNIQDNELFELAPGIYEFQFKCNPKLKKGTPTDILLNAALELTYGYNECEICKSSYFFHRIILIDTVKFLNNNILQEKFKGALKLANEDQEWLVLPFDSISNGISTSSRIPRADFWTVNHYVEI